MTKTIVIGQTVQPKKLNKIVFKKCLHSDNTIKTTNCTPDEFEYIELICKNYSNDDLIFAYNNPNDRSSGILYLGKWNDGVV